MPNEEKNDNIDNQVDVQSLFYPTAPKKSEKIFFTLIFLVIFIICLICVFFCISVPLFPKWRENRAVVYLDSIIGDIQTNEDNANLDNAIDYLSQLQQNDPKIYDSDRVQERKLKVEEFQRKVHLKQQIKEINREFEDARLLLKNYQSGLNPDGLVQCEAILKKIESTSFSFDDNPEFAK